MTLTRRDRVRILGEHYLDYLPSPKGMRYSSQPGESAGDMMPCDDCGGTGRKIGAQPCSVCRTAKRNLEREQRKAWAEGRRPLDMKITRNHGCRPCLTCDATGERPARKDENPPDPYTHGAPKLLDPHGPVVQRRHREDTGSAHGWELARAHLEMHGSFREFGVALERLRDEAPNAYSLVWQVVCGHQPIDVDQEVLDGVLDRLALYMPDRIRVPRWLLPDEGSKRRARRNARGRHADTRAQGSRDREIIAAYHEGKTVTVLAVEYGLTKGRVSQICSPVRRAAEARR